MGAVKTINAVNRITKGTVAVESALKVTTSTSKTAPKIPQVIEASDLTPKATMPKPTQPPKKNTCPINPVPQQMGLCFVGLTQVLTSSICGTGNTQQNIPISIYVKYGIVIISCGILLPYIHNQLKLRKKVEIPFQATCN